MIENSNNFMLTSFFFTETLNNFALNTISFDLKLFLNQINSIFNSYLTNSFTMYYLDLYYDVLLQNNLSYMLNINSNSLVNFINFNLLHVLKIFIKLNLFLFIVYLIFFISYIENYIQQLTSMNSFTKLFILNESEKEVGPVDDFFFFAVLFILTLTSFIISSFIVILLNSSIFTWAFGSLLLISILILTVPVNLFLDFGISFFVYIRGSASSSSLVKELLFDIISTFTVFIRFVIQNIRFLFIFSAIFELLEWVFSNNSSLFLINYYSNHNIFINLNISEYFYSNKSINLLVVNTILFIILYLYYFLHLLFLLLVQITIYIGISIWLFFFLYSTKFLGKYEKYFIFKK